MTPTLVIFAKAPLVGRVKSRLSAGLGAVGAAQFYRRSLAVLMTRMVRDPRWRVELRVTPDIAASERGGRFWPAGLACGGQGQGDLGARMARALGAPPAGPVIVIGSDLPVLRPAHVARAFALLGHHDVVLGPSADGGYWCVGARRVPRLPALFENVRWSSPHTLSDTLASLPQGTKVGLADSLDDVDTLADYRRWRQGDPAGLRLSAR